MHLRFFQLARCLNSSHSGRRLAMREAQAWRAPLVREIEAARSAYGRMAMTTADFLETELILTLLVDFLPNENPELAWAILNGYPFAAHSALPEEAQQAIA